jgi:hypothetical protein
LKALWTLSWKACLLWDHPTDAQAALLELGLLLLKSWVLLLKLGCLLLKLWILLKLGVTARKSSLHRVLKALLALSPLRHRGCWCSSRNNFTRRQIKKIT